MSHQIGHQQPLPQRARRINGFNRAYCSSAIQSFLSLSSQRDRALNHLVCFYEAEAARLEYRITIIKER